MKNTTWMQLISIRGLKGRCHWCIWSEALNKFLSDWNACHSVIEAFEENDTTTDHKQNFLSIDRNFLVLSVRLYYAIWRCCWSIGDFFKSCHIIHSKAEVSYQCTRLKQQNWGKQPSIENVQLAMHKTNYSVYLISPLSNPIVGKIVAKSSTSFLSCLISSGVPCSKSAIKSFFLGPHLSLSDCAIWTALHRTQIRILWYLYPSPIYSLMRPSPFSFWYANQASKLGGSALQSILDSKKICFPAKGAVETDSQHKAQCMSETLWTWGFCIFWQEDAESLLWRYTMSRYLSTNRATCLKSFSVNPLEVRAGAPIRNPPGTKADLSPGTVFLLAAMWPNSKTLSTLLPSTPLGLKSTNTKWFSVPANPLYLNM